MKPHHIIFLLLIVLAGCGERDAEHNAELRELYARLDTEIDRSADYDAIKEERIEGLRRQLGRTHDADRRTDIINELITEFEAYNADSALHYISLNIRRPETLAQPGQHTRLTIKRADVLAHAGLFSDALAILHGIPRDSLTADILEQYYSTCCATYQYLSEYTNEHETALDHERRRALYVDSLCSVVDTASFSHLVFVMIERARQGDAATAARTLTGCLDDYQSGTRDYSIMASNLAYIYKLSGSVDDYKRYLTLSAISDVKGAVKENMSYRELATVMYEGGDVERANRYLKKSIADANFYSAMMRNAQSSKVLPLIDDANAQLQERLATRLRLLVLATTVLSVVLVIFILLILKQFRSLRRANADAGAANAELSVISERLRAANAELEERNYELRDFNRTKEQYAGLFMEYCSTAISTLERYRQSLRVLAAQGANRAALMKKLEATEAVDQLLKNFYVRFDEAILNIYPQFVDKFNALLRPEERISLRSGELLNTELRLFALIRVGIDDSAKIADFLRCSISTVYTYRSKMRRRAIKPETFEDDVRNIA